jgi:hypothetical protein
MVGEKSALKMVLSVTDSTIQPIKKRILSKGGHEYDHTKKNDPDSSGMYHHPDVFCRYAWVLSRQKDSGIPANGRIEKYCRSEGPKD